MHDVIRRPRLSIRAFCDSFTKTILFLTSIVVIIIQLSCLYGALIITLKLWGVSMNDITGHSAFNDWVVDIVCNIFAPCLWVSVLLY